MQGGSGLESQDGDMLQHDRLPDRSALVLPVNHFAPPLPQAALADLCVFLAVCAWVAMRYASVRGRFPRLGHKR